MQIFAAFMFLGIFTTLLIPETKRKTLEELAGEVPGTSNYDPVSSGHGTRFRNDSKSASGSADAIAEGPEKV